MASAAATARTATPTQIQKLALCGRDDVDPRQIVYLPADGMSARDLTRAIVIGRDLTRSVDTSSGATRRVWLLDEVTSIDG